MELLRERQRRELQLARLHLRHNQQSNGNTLLTTVADGSLTRPIDSSGSSPHGAVNIPYHTITASHITSRLALPSSISLPGSPPHSSLLAQHLASFRDTLVCLCFTATNMDVIDSHGFDSRLYFHLFFLSHLVIACIAATTSICDEIVG